MILSSFNGALLPYFSTLVYPQLVMKEVRPLEDILSTGRTSGMFWVCERPSE